MVDAMSPMPFIASCEKTTFHHTKKSELEKRQKSLERQYSPPKFTQIRTSVSVHQNQKPERLLCALGI
ncbi:hypothetical protein ABTD21_19815, partial [Acinetobacter baumannii]